MEEAEEGKTGLKKTLTATQLILLGSGQSSGQGCLSETAAAAANNAGPSVTLGFVIAGLGCAFAGLCYAEFASMIPISGSAYTYSYATMGEFTAWVIGWDLVLEYALGAATVSIAWSEYLNKLFGYLNFQIPYGLCHSPMQVLRNSSGEIISHGYINLPALFIVIALSLLLIKGVRESSIFNGIIVITKVAIVILFIILGWSFIKASNHTPFIPAPGTYTDDQGVIHNFGASGNPGRCRCRLFCLYRIRCGIYRGAGNKGSKAGNADRDSWIIDYLYFVIYPFCVVLTGVAGIEDFRHAGKEASVTYTIQTYMHGYGWLAKLVTVAICRILLLILVMLYGHPRVFLYHLSKDGLVLLFSLRFTPNSGPPINQISIHSFCGSISSFVPGDIVGDMPHRNMFAFILVLCRIIILEENFILR